LKTHLLAILFLPLLTQIGYAQTPPELPDAQNSAFGIEPGQLYPGSLVLELMEAAEAEIENAVREAYAEGYKAAMLQYAPDAAGYRVAAEAMRAELEAERKKSRFFWPAVGASAGVSFVLGFLFHSITGR
jgi:hypothetical protein